MTEPHPRLYPLIEQQQRAVEPGDNIWLSASAGTGKTQVLTARVIRLMLEENVRPENILCITYTKAGAAEMAERINQRLAKWVQLDDKQIFEDLEAIGAEGGPHARRNASRLFAKVLDAPGGGLKITTIHSFCQSLLGSFPEEAGLVPGFKPVEGREQDELYREALSAMILSSESSTDGRLIKNMQSMALNMGEDAAFAFLKKCASQPVAIATVPDDKGAVVFSNRLVGIEFESSVSDMLAEACSDSVIDRTAIEQFALLNAKWGKPTGLTRADAIRDWLLLNANGRAEQLDSLLHCWTAKTTGTPVKQGPKDEAFDRLALELHLWGRNLKEQILLADYAQRLADALLVGKAFAAQYAKSKAERGLLDFDDMIRKTATMLIDGGMSDWIKFKLDQQIDHILVDEAQDTNAMQWDIIRALSDDFFSGVSAKSERNRTIFSVGDYKQAIFGFQGTDPKRYRDAGEAFANKIQQTGGKLQRLTLSQSFRSTQPVLDFVNAVVANAGSDAFGISDSIDDHFGEKPDCGMIELFSPVVSLKAESDIGADEDIGSDENWLTTEKAKLAHQIAGYVKQLIDEKPVLASTKKPLVPGDIMILLRGRSDLAASLIGRLHAAGVPVSGIDRLKLVEPIAVQDLMAAVRFVLQPSDDMSLACMLVSPLFGWSQEQLLQFGYRPRNVTLWQHIRGREEIANDVDALRAILNSADFTTPYQFLETILSGPLRGRKKMIARLGSEAMVPIEELLNAALQFEQNCGGTLQAFLAWFESGDSEVKRDSVASKDEVRILTVHGSKGLQAPVVILADVTKDPKSKPTGSNELVIDDGSKLPLLTIRSAENVRRLAQVTELQKTREMEEHFRLLYVAITRAEERLVMAGALGSRSKGVAAPESWYSIILSAMQAMGCEWEDAAPWKAVLRYKRESTLQVADNNEPAAQSLDISLPEWINTDAPEERRPPRPLVPSHIGDDDYGDAPASAAMQTAMEKGKLIHGLFERIRGDDFIAWENRGMAWLNRNNSNPSISSLEIIASVKAVISNPDWAIFFGQSAHAEVPLTAVVGDTVITGRVDRLVIEPGIVRVLDFKTGRDMPRRASDLPVAILRQMAHYVAALEVIFPAHCVEAALLFTHGPALLMLTTDDLAPHKPAS